MKALSFFKIVLINCLVVLFISRISFAGNDTLTFNDIYKDRKLIPKGIRGLKSMNDGKTYCVLENDSVNVYDYRKGTYMKTIFTRNDLIIEGTDSTIYLGRYTFDQSETKVIIPSETESIYRHSSKSNYYIYDISTKVFCSLSENGKQRLADFSPDGSKVAFVRLNNIFIKDIESGQETQVTFDGSEDRIINGTTDWVYEEEFGFVKGFRWSHDGEKIAFYRFDESDVNKYNMQMWGELYPDDYLYKYPKAGEDNSIVTIHIYELNSGKTINVDIGEIQDQYIPRINWTNENDVLWIQRLNRLQNKLEILLVNANTGNSKVIYEEKNEFYIDITDNLTFLDDNKHFIITNETDGFNHIYLYNIEGKKVKQLTNGRWDVIEMIGYDTDNNLVFYTAAKSAPVNREIYSVTLEGHNTQVSQRVGNNTPVFSKTYQYYINNFSDANTPPFITVNKRDGKEIRVLQDNAKLIETINELGYSQKEFFTIKTSEDVELNAWRILPWDFDKTKKYPVLMYVYGGPGSQTVLNSWQYSINWYQFLAEQGIMIVSVDNRGTGARGEDFKKMTYLELGKYETIDQIEAAKYLSALDYVNPDRIAMFGWSYGGFMSTLCLSKGADVFCAAVAVAPVSNWRYYDNIYTERFMRTPQENPSGYDKNSPINHIDKIKGELLLVHGTGDDNVHVQNSVDLISALVDANVQFDLMLYPNKNHGIYGGNTRYHLYTKISEFLFRTLK
jgi:dipeptidyl-peptidase-4